MRLEGTLDAFSLPDVFSLLSMTRKTGTLHLRREALHGAIHLREGAGTGARSDGHRQALGRRVVGAGAVDDATLASAVEELVDRPGAGLGKLLVERAGLDRDAAELLAGEQATDAVFDLMRWPDGEFAFVIDEDDPDDVGLALPVDGLVAEARRRLEEWAALTAAVPAPDALVSLSPSPAEPPTLSAEEWQLLGLVDGHRTVADLVEAYGRGDFALVRALAGMVERGLLVVHTPGDGDATGAVVRRQQLLAALEGRPLPVPAAPPAPVAAPVAEAPAVPSVPAQVIPERPEPFTPPRRVEHPEPSPAYARASSPGAPAAGGSVGAVHGSTALQPDAAPAGAPSPVERDPSVNKSLLLRLIAGVRGL